MFASPLIFVQVELYQVSECRVTATACQVKMCVRLICCKKMKLNAGLIIHKYFCFHFLCFFHPSLLGLMGFSMVHMFVSYLK